MRSIYINVGISLSSVLFILSVSEFVLYVTDYPRLYNLLQVAAREVKSNQLAKWWVYDPEVGTKFNRFALTEQVLNKALASTPNWERLKIINIAGYHDKDEFVSDVAQKSENKIFFIGDSFTWGASVNIGLSFVETFES